MDEVITSGSVIDESIGMIDEINVEVSGEDEPQPTATPEPEPTKPPTPKARAGIERGWLTTSVYCKAPRRNQRRGGHHYWCKGASRPAVQRVAKGLTYEVIGKSLEAAQDFAKAKKLEIEDP